MSKFVQIINVFLISVFFAIANANAVEMPSTDDGTDENGDLIVAPTLALRCGLSSKEPDITPDCLDRLAYDYKSGKLVNDEFKNYDEERKAIIGEYSGAYFQNALEQLVAASGYEDKINEDICIDTTKPSCMNLSNDSRAEIEYNNKLAEYNAAILLDAVKLRAQDLNMESLNNMLSVIVPAKDVDLSNKSLAGAP
ncbi:MAG: hypothetical protein IKA30_02475 [Alphaproteobacteria bacterium]|nr:hypothetical protein [Alphaproteobacteria bacterium]